MKKSQSIPQPLGTVPYHVKKSETLFSIAAQCDVSVTVLKKLNRLMTETIFPDQILYVPGPDFTSANSVISSSPTEKAAKESKSCVSIPAKPEESLQSELSTSPPIKPFPGHAERQAVPLVKALSLPRALSEDEVKKIDEELHERFVKMNARYIEPSDQEEIPGVLLVTPDAVMFDADESHPLVLQNGRETFQLVAAIPHVMVVTVYHGTSTIRCGRIATNKTAATTVDENTLQTTVSRSDSKEEKSGDKMPDQLNMIDDHFETEQKNNIGSTSSHHSSPVEHLVAAGNVDEKNVPQVSGKIAEDRKNSDGAVGMGDDVSRKRDGVPEADGMEKSLSSQVRTEEPDVHGGNGSASAENKDQGTSTVNHALPSGESGNERLLADVSSPCEKQQDLGDKGTVHKKNFMECDGDSATDQNKMALQSLETGPEALHKGQAAAAEDTLKLQSSPSAEGVSSIPVKDGESVSPGQESPLTVFLHLKIDRGIDAMFGESPTAIFSQIPVKSEYWYSIPVDKVDLLYTFFVQWTTEGDRLKGFVVVQTESSSEYKKYNTMDGQKLVYEIVKDWELINAKERKRMQSEAEIRKLPLPDLNGQSSIMETSHIGVLIYHLPPIAEGSPWNLLYSASQHGFSLSTLYRKMAQIDSPVLLIIKDLSDQVFGAMISCTLRMSDHFYGSGETYLFTFYPEFKKFAWTGVNSFFVKGNKESLVIGASEGSNGLWLDGALFRGRTQSCQTFNNELLTISQDFTIKCLETWCFGS